LALRLSASALLLLSLAGLAFWPGYLSRIQAADRYTHAHAILGTSWLLLLVVQPWLVKISRRSWHRRVGRIGLLVGASFFVSGVLMAHRSLARMTPEQFSREGRFVYLPLAMAGIFALALLMAVAWRSAPAIHGRFMAATALPLLDPLLARLVYFYAPPLPAESLHQVPAFLLVGAILFWMSASLPDTARGRDALRHFSWTVVALLLGFFIVPHAAGWDSFTSWFRALPIT